jgi:methylenetetrahydrofolate--tRNA-(uracil-5-)-methyltransferase
MCGVSERVVVIGGGLAGSEAAWQAAEGGLAVELWEMRAGGQLTPAHRTPCMAELVCSNSLGSMLPDRASGVLIAELEKMGSLLVQIAREVALPAGGALAVDRQRFSRNVHERLLAHPRIRVIPREARRIPEGLAIVASGPLTSDALAQDLGRLTGEEHLYFFDALAPIVEAESIDLRIAFRGSRYGRGQTDEGDYLNCPLNKGQYDAFVEALQSAERIPLRSFEEQVSDGVIAGRKSYFEGCLPIEILAARGHLALAYGPMRPVGLIDPRTGKRPFAVVQLRQDDLAGSLYNMVGFQTNLKHDAQRCVLRMIPGLGNARFVRFGQMHRNTYVNAPALLAATLQHRQRLELLLAGQIIGVEGYLGNIGTGLLAGVNACRIAHGHAPLILPLSTMLGALCHYVAHSDALTFQPMKANFGLLPPLGGGKRANKRERARMHAERSSADLAEYWETHADCA